MSLDLFCVTRILKAVRNYRKKNPGSMMPMRDLLDCMGISPNPCDFNDAEIKAVYKSDCNYKYSVNKFCYHVHKAVGQGVLDCNITIINEWIGGGKLLTTGCANFKPDCRAEYKIMKDWKENFRKMKKIARQNAC